MATTEEVRLRARALQDQAIQAALEADWNRALELNKSIVDGAPDDIDARMRMGRALLEIGRVDEARDAYAEVLRIEEKIKLLGKRDPAAVAEFRKALDLRLRHWEPVFDLKSPFADLPSVFTAVGMLVSDVERHFVRAFPAPLSALGGAEAGRVLDALSAEALAALAAEGYGAAEATVGFEADLRFSGQDSELSCAFDAADRSDTALAALAGRFLADYERVYQYRAEEPIERAVSTKGRSGVLARCARRRGQGRPRNCADA